MEGAAALVWQVTPGKDRERDEIVTSFVVAEGGKAVVRVARKEAVFSSQMALWRLASDKLTTKALDCRLDPPREAPQKRHHIVLESLGKKPARIGTMKHVVKESTHARFDLLAMAGPFVSYQISSYTADDCSGHERRCWAPWPGPSPRPGAPGAPTP